MSDETKVVMALIGTFALVLVLIFAQEVIKLLTCG